MKKDFWVSNCALLRIPRSTTKLPILNATYQCNRNGLSEELILREDITEGDYLAYRSGFGLAILSLVPMQIKMLCLRYARLVILLLD